MLIAFLVVYSYHPVVSTAYLVSNASKYSQLQCEHLFLTHCIERNDFTLVAEGDIQQPYSIKTARPCQQSNYKLKSCYS